MIKWGQIEKAAFFLWRHRQHGRHFTSFENRDFICKYKLHVWPIFYTIFMGKDYDYALRIEVKSHQMSLNAISRSQCHKNSHSIVLNWIGPTNTYAELQNTPRNFINLQVLSKTYPLLIFITYSESSKIYKTTSKPHPRYSKSYRV